MSDTVTKANRDITSLQPVAQKAATLFLDECKKRGIDIFVTEYYRSQARQDYLYEQGRTKPGKIVTWTRSSNHTAGYAWDIAVSPPHELYDEKIICKAGEVAKELGIEWGGDWKERDLPHFQVDKNWKPPVTEVTQVTLHEIEIELNGKQKMVQAIHLDGFNYVKLRDLADDKILVDYNKIPIIKVKE